MANLPKMTRAFELSTPLGDGALLFHRMMAREELGRLSEFEIDALSERSNLDPDQILGKSVTVRETLRDGGMRPFTGHVARFGLTGVHGRYHVYRLVVRPWLWFLTRTANCRIFQQMTVPDILKKIFETHADVANVTFELTGDYREWDYCVQYRESDFDFVSRLLEHEGIYYYFRHVGDTHTLVLTDTCSMHSAFPGCEQLPFVLQERDARDVIECIDSWRFDREIQPVRYAHDNYDPEKPRAELQRSASIERQHAQAQYEIYDYPAKHTDTKYGEHYARLRVEELHTRFETAQGHTNARGLGVGYLFKLSRHPRADQNREYLVSAAQYEVSDAEHESGNGAAARYACSFTALDSSQSFRSQRSTPKPIVQGPQTAVVVGPPGEEIHTDHQGRVKVQFHWDRYSAGDQTSSCWIRVSQPWAGKGWGGMSIPRIGQEVIVDFLEGDPDRPIITGRVYNAEQMPPYAMPGMVSGLMSQTHKGVGHNEMSMDDTAGQEKLTLNGQHDMNTTVGNDQTNTIKNNRSTTVQTGNDTLSVMTGNRSVTVKGDSSHTVVSGSRAVQVQAGDYMATAAQAVSLYGKGKGVSIIGDKEGVVITGNDKGVTLTGNKEGVSITGTVKGVAIFGTGEGVYIEGKSKGVQIVGKDKGVGISGEKDGVFITGKGKGVTLQAVRPRASLGHRT